MDFGILTSHWETISAVVLALGGIATAVRMKAYTQAAALALNLVKDVVKKELDEESERVVLADLVYANLPLWSKKLVTQKQMEEIVESAFKQL